MDEQNINEPAKLHRNVGRVLLVLAVLGLICGFSYFHGWRIKEKYLLHQLAELEPEATRPSGDKYGSLAILNNEAGHRSMEISMRLHKLRYANDASYRKTRDSLPKLSDFSQKELEEKLAKLDPNSETMNALHLLAGPSLAAEAKQSATPNPPTRGTTSVPSPEYPTYSLDDFLIGMDTRREEIIDVSFIQDMLPDQAVIRATGRSAQIVCGIRIVDKKPILMLKLVHFQQRGILGVKRITVATASDSFSYDFDPKMVSRQSVDFGTIEFATIVPSHDKNAANFLDKLVEHAETCNIEVAGANDRFTTFTPTRENTAHTIAVADLYLKMLRDATWIDGVVERALPNEVYLQRIQAAMSLDDLR